MPCDDDLPTKSASAKDRDDPPAAAQQQQQQRRSQPGRGIFSIPPPLKRLFDNFPLAIYDANELPLRAPQKRHQHVLHVFTTASDARHGRPSFNPSCLRWQTFLNLAGLDFVTHPSSNHASPSGALPYLQPAMAVTETAGTKAGSPVPSNRLKKWLAASSHTKKGEDWRIDEVDDVRYEAYAALLEERIRKAWLYQLYINPANATVVDRLYLRPGSSNTIVRLVTGRQLRNAAMSQLSTSSAATIVEADLVRGAEETFSALAILLGDDEWFFGRSRPTLFDASVFAYTHLIVGAGADMMAWEENSLAGSLNRYSNIVRHQERIARVYY